MRRPTAAIISSVRSSRCSGLGAEHAGVGVAVEQAERDLVEGGLDRRDLSEDVDAVAVLLDHLLDAADLPSIRARRACSWGLRRLVALAGS